MDDKKAILNGTLGKTMKTNNGNDDMTGFGGIQFCVRKAYNGSRCNIQTFQTQ